LKITGVKNLGSSIILSGQINSKEVGKKVWLQADAQNKNVTKKVHWLMSQVNSGFITKVEAN